MPAQATVRATDVTGVRSFVLVTDARGCTANATAIITQPAAALSASIASQVNVLCFGGSTGSATASGSGGTAPYTFKIGSAPGRETAKATNLNAGRYNVTGHDASG